jgi:hypothetical protein
MRRTLRQLVISGIALFCAAWMLVLVLVGIGYGVSSWSKSPLDAVIVFTATLLVGGLGIAFGCVAAEMLAPARPPAAPRGFEVLPPRR